MSSAARRVFDVAELLEMIIVEVGALAVKDEENQADAIRWRDLEARKMEPITTISRLSSVNTTFRLCIKHSRPIKLAMYNGPNSSTDSGEQGGHILPLRWFLGKALDQCKGPYGDSRDGLWWPAREFSIKINSFRRQGSNRPSRAFSKFKSTEGKYQEARWRSVKVNAHAFRATTVIVSLSFLKPKKGYEGLRNLYRERLVLRPETTLGDVFDMFEALGNRTSKEHADRAVRYTRFMNTFGDWAFTDYGLDWDGLT
ncbi:uncharacterized protein RCC_07748 [Ramularia collo-cygni]|uniref:Uncharacterized protein n=1 Tax=Ramularia collo-cygni TaxID=112498 RepID=A0A2D3UVV0_9PEZI|nr:uncharacterized protein RCC_07748 [Ramularia collo-cygni]CZT21882.1 uncharacterized protein RCC_07748 [Ramularia collo-cygni]